MSNSGSSQQRVSPGTQAVEPGARGEGWQIEPPSGEGQTVISQSPPISTQPVQAGLQPAELGQQLEGERLGHFMLDQFIGGGGMGAVFRATDTMLNRTVAVKILATDQANDTETQRRFKNEAQSAARLDHDNIARVYYVGEDRGVHYIVLEYIEGLNLRDLVFQEGPLPLDAVISYTLQIAHALAHASEREVVHRDIKPSNVLITNEGRAKLVDMGLARLYQVEHTGNDLTASGVTLGTFDYISPEQARDPRTADVRSDLYSLGCTMYYMLTGQPPFPEGTVLQKLLQHQGDEAPNVRDLRPDLPVAVAGLVAKLLAKSPTKRFQHPSELIGALVLLSEQMGIDATVGNSHVWVAPVRPRRRIPLANHLPWILPVLLLLLGVYLIDRYWDAAVRAIDGTGPPPASDVFSPVDPPGDGK